MTITTYRRIQYQRLLIGNMTVVVDAIGIDPDGVPWVRLSIQALDGVRVIAPEREWQVRKRDRRRVKA